MEGEEAIVVYFKRYLSIRMRSQETHVNFTP
jgi:hypothetical protein